jgi:hypothetical protein
VIVPGFRMAAKASHLKTRDLVIGGEIMFVKSEEPGFPTSERRTHQRYGKRDTVEGYPSKEGTRGQKDSGWKQCA